MDPIYIYIHILFIYIYIYIYPVVYPTTSPTIDPAIHPIIYHTIAHTLDPADTAYRLNYAMSQLAQANISMERDAKLMARSAA